VITVGGFRAADVSHVAGILVGNPTRVTRDIAIPVVPTEELQRWACEQAALGRNVYHDQGALLHFAACVRSCGGDTGDLPIAAYGSDWLSFPEIAGKKDWPEEIVLCPYEDYLAAATFHPASIGVSVRGGYVPFVRGRRLWPPWRTIGLDRDNFPEIAVIEALAKAWDASLEEVLRVSLLRHRYPSDDPIEAERLSAVLRSVGVEGGLGDSSVIKMPKTAE
jgi:hypothetical protein